MDPRLRALNRFGLGARIGEAGGLRDPRGWLRDQVKRGRPEPLDGPDLEELGSLLNEFRAAQRTRDQEKIRPVARKVGEVSRAEAHAVLDRRVATEHPFVERLVAFWSNHLCVSVRDSAPVRLLAGHYERTAIRPHVLGSFTDMVLASARHPAMLIYLDNAQSIGPGSRGGRGSARRGRPRGLNENYARELLELHTLGVDGGYTQADVEALARILTGWTVAGLGPAPGRRGGRRRERFGFVFREVLHEPGAKTVLGRTYRERGEREGKEVIRDLCAHPSTARFVATKLVRHFVSDDPPLEAVEELAGVFRESRGDLRRVSLALVELEAAWDPGTRKFRTPQDWVVAVFRTFHAREAPGPVAQLLEQLRHALWAPEAPKGYGDTLREWGDPDGLMNRAELARTLADRLLRGARRRTPEPERLLEVVDVPADDPLRRVLADSSVPRDERFTLALAGPAFQWR